MGRGIEAESAVLRQDYLTHKNSNEPLFSRPKEKTLKNHVPRKGMILISSRGLET
jgi:hypothetical protein